MHINLITWCNLPTYDATEAHPYNCLNTWSTRVSDTEIRSTQMTYMFFPPKNCTTQDSTPHFQKHLASNETTVLRLTHKNPRLYWHVNSATLPQSCTTHWQSSCCTIHDMYLPPNTGHFLFVTIFISSSDIWILTVLHFHAKEMQSSKGRKHYSLSPFLKKLSH